MAAYEPLGNRKRNLGGSPTLGLHPGGRWVVHLILPVAHCENLNRRRLRASLNLFLRKYFHLSISSISKLRKKYHNRMLKLSIHCCSCDLKYGMTLGSYCRLWLALNRVWLRGSWVYRIMMLGMPIGKVFLLKWWKGFSFGRGQSHSQPNRGRVSPRNRHTYRWLRDFL